MVQSHQRVGDILKEKMGFQQTMSDSVVFLKEVEGGKLIVGGHVDDFLVIAPTDQLLDSFGEQLAQHLKIKSGQLDTFLGVQSRQDPVTGTITIHHQGKIVDLLTEFGMINTHPVSTPMQPGIQISRADCPTTEEESKGINYRAYRSAVGSLMHAHHDHAQTYVLL